ncbi:MAG: interleukin-like EMT inducer domain-containing protein, partial [Arenicellales bacterium]
NTDIIRSIYGLRYVLIHPEFMRDESVRRAWVKLGNNPPAGLRKVGTFGHVIVLKVERHSEQLWTWNRYLSTGQLRKASDASFSTTIPPGDGDIRHQVDVEFNDVLVKHFDNASGRMDHEIRLPGPYRRSGPDELVLRDRYRITAPTAGNPAYRVGTSNVYSPDDIVVTSAGQRYGSMAAIWIDGQHYELARYRGYSAAVVDPATGKVVAHGAFNTAGHAAESRRLVNFFKRVKPGYIVAVALDRYGGKELTDEAFQAFQSIGATIDPRKYSIDSSHVIIGVKGAGSGTAVEAIGNRAITRVIGVDRRDQAMTVADFHLVPPQDVASR